MNNPLITQLKTQLEKLIEMEFYQRKLALNNIRPSDIQTLTDFEQIPFTTSDELFNELKKAPKDCSFYSDKITRINLSPSGKELYPVYHTQHDIDIMHQVCGKSLAAAGVTEDDICAVTFGYHLFVAGLFYQSQLEAYGAKVIPLGPGESDRAVRLINELNVSVLISNPTFAMKLASKGIPSVRILFVGGEPFTSVSGYAQKVRDAFKKDITIIDSYSMASCLPIARSCRYDTGLHIMDDFVYAEVVDPATGKCLAYGEKGELVLTHLKKEAAPLLRYRTGDLTVMENRPCLCGRTFSLPKSVFGRTDEMLKIKGVKFWPSQVGNILREFSGMSNTYRIVVSEEGGVDFLRLMVEKNDDPEVDKDRLINRLKQETLLTFNEILFIEKMEAGPLVIDERKGRTF